MQGFGDEQLIREIGEIFGLHPLAMEDVVNMPQRPKAEAYEGQVLLALGDHLEQLENVVMENPSNSLLRELNRTKNMLVNLRRAVWPQREAINSLIRDENPLVGDEVRLFLRDTYDHCVQTAEVIEMYRELATGLMNTYLSSIANRTNEVMKVLTIMASIFIPLTFLAGIYGMNFEHMPELHVRWAYPTVWVAMLSVGLGMFTFFWRKGWIGPQSSPTNFRDPPGSGSSS